MTSKKKKKREKPNRLKRAVYPMSLALATGLSVYVLLPGFRDLEGVRARIAELRRSAREESLRNEALRKEIESMDTAEGVERAARQHLRLARPGEMLIVFETPKGTESAE